MTRLFRAPPSRAGWAGSRASSAARRRSCRPAGRVLAVCGVALATTWQLSFRQVPAGRGRTGTVMDRQTPTSTGLQQGHGAAVKQDVRVDSLALQRRASLRCGLGVGADAQRDGVAAEPPSGAHGRCGSRCRSRHDGAMRVMEVPLGTDDARDLARRSSPSRATFGHVTTVAVEGGLTSNAPADWVDAPSWAFSACLAGRSDGGARCDVRAPTTPRPRSADPRSSPLSSPRSGAGGTEGYWGARRGRVRRG